VVISLSTREFCTYGPFYTQYVPFLTTHTTTTQAAQIAPKLWLHSAGAQWPCTCTYGHKSNTHHYTVRMITAQPCNLTPSGRNCNYSGNWQLTIRTHELGLPRLLPDQPHTRASTLQLAPLSCLLTLCIVLLSAMEISRFSTSQIVKVVASSTVEILVIDPPGESQ